jgi:leader peptidase (prepilin peptidase)/N-methyltransferase
MHHAVLEVALWLLGLCVGSFLNVVVYRLPIGLSIAKPRWSFCPCCRATIAWYDNIPLLSWLVLGGRCRHCRSPISVQYPLVEGLTGLAFVLVYHLLFVAPAGGETRAAVLPADLPLLLTWLVLAAGLVACSAMDIASYTVDVRVTGAIMWTAIGLHALWPRAESLSHRAGSAWAAAAVAAFLVSGLTFWWRERRRGPDLRDEPSGEAKPAELLTETGRAGVQAVAGRISILAFVLVTGWLVYIAFPGGLRGWPPGAAAAALLMMFGVIVLAGGQQRPADAEIRAAIEEEQPQARRMVLGELLWLAPAILVAVLVLAILGTAPLAGESWSGLVAWSPVQGYAPLAGAVVAISGAIVGALAGWALRIVFTLAFGREAFGVGDIHILAAAGAAGGWDIALLGLLLSVAIALAGWLLSLLRKSTVMIPFGPWLALGFVLALWWRRPAGQIASAYWGNIAFAWQEQPNLLAVAGGLMLVGVGAALILARLVRRWVAPETP